MKRDRAIGWLFSAAVAAYALFVFWDGLLPHRVQRPKFQPPVGHPKPVEMPIVAPMELPPPAIPRQAEAAPMLPKLPPAEPPGRSKIAP